MSILVKNTMAERVYHIANKLNLPISTVERIIKAYHEDLIASVVRGEDIGIDRIFSVHVLRNYSTGEIIARGSVSPVLRKYLENTDSLAYKKD